MYIGLHVKYPNSGPICKGTWVFSTDFRRTPKYKISWKSVQCELSCPMWTAGQADATKLIRAAACRNLANAPIKDQTLREQSIGILWWHIGVGVGGQTGRNLSAVVTAIGKSWHVMLFPSDIPQFPYPSACDLHTSVYARFRRWVLKSGICQFNFFEAQRFQPNAAKSSEPWWACLWNAFSSCLNGEFHFMDCVLVCLFSETPCPSNAAAAAAVRCPA